MKDENCITILGWMLNRLNLSGNELFCYAMIFGFSQDGKSEYYGSTSYLAETLGISKRSAIDVLARLVDKGLLNKRSEIINSVKFCRYSAVIPDFISSKRCSIEESSQVVKKMFDSGEESSHNNKIDNKEYIKEEILKKKDDLDFVSDDFKDAVSLWLSYKKERKESYKSKMSVEIFYKQLLQLSNNDCVLADKIVRQSIANNWAGIFKLKADGRTTQSFSNNQYDRIHLGVKDYGETDF